MNVTLLHNPASGDGHPSGAFLIDRFESAGHRVIYRSIAEPGWADAIEPTAELIVAAGGDGTARRVVLALAGLVRASEVPLALIPIGTANNIARSLELHDGIDGLVHGLHGARRTRLAVGVARGGWGESRFVESAGVGLVAALLRRSELEEDENDKDPKATRVQAGIDRLRRELTSTEPRHLRIDADGVDLSGDYLLVEAMNIASIGPGVALAPDADQADDWLDLVLAGEGDRETLDDYLHARRDGTDRPMPIPVRRVRKLRMTWPPDDGHLDDTVWPESVASLARPDGTVAIEIDHAIPILIPSC